MKDNTSQMLTLHIVYTFPGFFHSVLFLSILDFSVNTRLYSLSPSLAPAVIINERILLSKLPSISYISHANWSVMVISKGFYYNDYLLNWYCNKLVAKLVLYCILLLKTVVQTYSWYETMLAWAITQNENFSELKLPEVSSGSV